MKVVNVSIDENILTFPDGRVLAAKDSNDYSLCKCKRCKITRMSDECLASPCNVLDRTDRRNVVFEERVEPVDVEFWAIYSGKKVSVTAKDLWDAKNKAIDLLKVPKKNQGLLSVISKNSYSKGDFKFG